MTKRKQYTYLIPKVMSTQMVDAINKDPNWVAAIYETYPEQVSITVSTKADDMDKIDIFVGKFIRHWTP